MKKYIFASVTALILLCLGCDLEKEIDIELPDYEQRVVVEAYLEPGQPLRLLLSLSAPYFEKFPIFEGQFIENTLVSDAEVSIHYNGQTFQLNNRLIFDEERRKIYNYQHPFVVPEDYDRSFELDILTKAGVRIQASTRLLPPVPIDSLVVEFREQDTLARLLTYLSDPPAQDNYYRRLLHSGSLLNQPEQDFTTSDQIVEDILLFGTGFEYAAGDTLISSIYHLDIDYYNYLRSVQNAELANGNPFAQPSPIISNVKSDSEKVIGIFTGLSYFRKEVIVE